MINLFHYIFYSLFVSFWGFFGRGSNSVDHIIMYCTKQMQNKICSLDGVNIEFLAGPYSWSPCTLLATASVLPQKRLYISIVLILPLQMAVTMPGCMVKFKQERLKFKAPVIFGIISENELIT